MQVGSLLCSLRRRDWIDISRRKKTLSLENVFIRLPLYSSQAKDSTGMDGVEKPHKRRFRCNKDGAYKK